MKLNDLKAKNILMLGFGKEGQDSFLALRNLFPKKSFGIADVKPLEQLPVPAQKILKSDKNLTLHLGEDYLNCLKDFDLIIKTPGIPQEKIKPFLDKGAKTTSQTEIFFANCQGTIIGVTGTKGKGTTSSLIYQILKQAGLKTHLIGNIGKPVLQVLTEKDKEKDIFVYELSSHQLQGLKKSPHIAVFLSLYPAHLDYYGTFQKYQEAKENIALYQKKSDFFVYNANQKILKEISQKTKAQKISFSSKQLAGEWLLTGKEKIIKKKEVPLKGDFNLLNALASIEVAKIFDIPREKIKKAIVTFKPLPFRLERVGEYQGIEFYNDSLATVPQAIEAALDGLGNKVKTLIVGGEDVPGFNFAGVAKKILQNKVKTLILFPDTGQKIWKEIIYQEKQSLPQAFFTSSMEKAVKLSYQRTGAGEICLLSPGSPSFNLFTDYKERGDLFNCFVKKYGQKSS